MHSKVTRKLTINVLIFIYFISFFIPTYRITISLSVLLRKQNIGQRNSDWYGSHGKAWHIGNTERKIYSKQCINSYIYIYFFWSLNICFSVLFFCVVGQHKIKTAQKNPPCSPSARFDTFGILEYCKQELNT